MTLLSNSGQKKERESVPVTRVKLAKNHSALVLIESTVGFTTILPQLVAM
jgi:hypothetical protein